MRWLGFVASAVFGLVFAASIVAAFLFPAPVKAHPLFGFNLAVSSVGTILGLAVAWRQWRALHPKTGEGKG